MKKIYTNSQCPAYIKAVENLDIGVAIADSNDRYIFVNKAHAKLYGYKQEELIGKTFKTLVSKKIFSMSRKAWEQAKKNKKITTQEFEMPNLRKDGKEFIGSVKATLLRDKNGNFKGHICIVEDITVKKKKEEEISSIYTATNLAQDGIIICDNKGKILHANNIILNIHGKDVIGQPSINLIKPSERKRIIENQKKLQKVKNLSIEYTAITKNGVEIPIEATSSAIIDKSGRNIGFVVIARDVTERKKMELQVIESEEKYRTITETIPDCVKIFDLNGKCLFVNKAAITNHHYEFKNQTMIGQSLKRMQPEREWQQTKNDFEKAKKGQLINSEYVSLIPDIGKVYYLRSYIPIQDANGKTTSIQMICRDITLIKKTEERLHHLNQIHAALTEINQLIFQIHHQEELFQKSCCIAVKKGLLKMAWIGLVDTKTLFVKPVASCGAEKGYLKNIKISISSKVPEGRGPTGTAIRQGKYFICNDIENAPMMLPWRKMALVRGYRSSAAFPIKLGGQIIGTINLYADKPYFFDKDITDLLRSLANDISATIESINFENQRKQAEEKIKENETKFRKLFETAKDAILILDPNNGKIIDSNPFIQDLLEYTPEELIGKKVFEISPLKNVVQNKDKLIELQKKGYAVYEKLPLKSKSGKLHHIEFISNVYTIGDREILQWNLRDMTDRYKAEAELKESEEKSRDILESTTDLIQSVAPDGKILYVNKAWKEKLGYEDKELAKKNIFDILHQECMGHCKTAFQETMEGKKFDTVEAIFKTKKGEKIFVEGNISCKFENGKPLYTRGVFHDITERKIAEENLQKMTKELETKNIQLRKNIKLFEGRELKMVELKKRIQQLEADLRGSK